MLIYILLFAATLSIPGTFYARNRRQLDPCKWICLFGRAENSL
jgi:hypothetical protein